jgi:hypothetical protein|eukprot:COSAG01_NODE_1425_length_10350_cov_38.096283_8_plen_130_part_00
MTQAHQDRMCQENPTCCGEDAFVCPGSTGKQVLATFSGSLSLLGSAFVVYQFHQQYGLQTLPATVFSRLGAPQAAAGSLQSDVGTRLVIWLSLTDMLSSLFMVLGPEPIKVCAPLLWLLLARAPELAHV